MHPAKLFDTAHEYLQRSAEVKRENNQGVRSVRATRKPRFGERKSVEPDSRPASQRWSIEIGTVAVTAQGASQQKSSYLVAQDQDLPIRPNDPRPLCPR